MARNPIEDILDDCLERLQHGESIAMCLIRYADYAEELEPLLVASVSTTSVPLEPDPAFRTAAQFRFQGAVRHRLAQQRDREASQRSWWQFGLPTWTRAWVSMTAGLLLPVSIGGGVAFASTGALPDSPLYPIKRATERARLAMTPSESGRALLHLEYVDRRTKELAAMAEAGNTEMVDRLSRELVREIELARAEAGLATLGDETLALSSAAPAIAQAESAPVATALQAESLETTATATEGAPSLERQTDNVQAVSQARPQQQVAPTAQLLAYIQAEQDVATKNLVRMAFVLQHVPPELRPVLLGLMSRTQARYTRARTPSANTPAVSLDRVLVIRGIATVRDNVLFLGDRRVSFAKGAEISGRPRTGDQIIVGLLVGDGGGFTGVKMEILSRRHEQTPVVILQGLIQRVGEDRFTIPGYQVTWEEGITVTGPLEPGRLVLVEGPITGPGIILAERIAVFSGSPISTTD